MKASHKVHVCIYCKVMHSVSYVLSFSFFIMAAFVLWKIWCFVRCCRGLRMFALAQQRFPSDRSGDINMTLLLLMFHTTHIRNAAVIYDQLQTLSQSIRRVHVNSCFQ